MNSCFACKYVNLYVLMCFVFCKGKSLPNTVSNTWLNDSVIQIIMNMFVRSWLNIKRWENTS